jgi:hypothetical protein
MMAVTAGLVYRAIKRTLTRNRIGVAVISVLAWSHASSTLADDAAGRDLPADNATAQYKYT